MKVSYAPTNCPDGQCCDSCHFTRAPLGICAYQSLVWDIVTLRAVYWTAQCLQHSIVGCSVDGRQTDIALQAL